MADTPNPDARPHPDNDHNRGAERDQPAGRARHLGRDPDASPAFSSGPDDDLRRLTPGEERDLHFNGFPRYDMRPLHDLCSPGGCQYKTRAENLADLDAWYLGQDREPDQDDPEVGL
jgi:hypothetical protein